LAEQLQNLKDAYLSEPNPTCADQRAALDAYDGAWLWLQSPAACGNGAYGSAGNRCISDRAPNGKFPWKTYYRDPIANDPRLAGKNGDTGNAVFLPNLSPGTYQQTGVTPTGGDATTGTAPSPPATPAPAPSSFASTGTIAGIPTP